jgi:hypothetical protein
VSGDEQAVGGKGGRVVKERGAGTGSRNAECGGGEKEGRKKKENA